MKGIRLEFGTIMKLAGREGGVCPYTPTYGSLDTRQADMQLAQISLSLPIAVQVNILPLITTSELLVLKINVGQFCKWSDPKLPHVKIKLHESEGNN